VLSYVVIILSKINFILDNISSEFRIFITNFYSFSTNYGFVYINSTEPESNVKEENKNLELDSGEEKNSPKSKACTKEENSSNSDSNSDLNLNQPSSKYLDNLLNIWDRAREQGEEENDEEEFEELRRKVQELKEAQDKIEREKSYATAKRKFEEEKSNKIQETKDSKCDETQDNSEQESKRFKQNTEGFIPDNTEFSSIIELSGDE
jgi:hypothetical protein